MHPAVDPTGRLHTSLLNNWVYGASRLSSAVAEAVAALTEGVVDGRLSGDISSAHLQQDHMSISSCLVITCTLSQGSNQYPNGLMLPHKQVGCNVWYVAALGGTIRVMAWLVTQSK